MDKNEEHVLIGVECVSLKISALFYLLSLTPALSTFNVARVMYLNLHRIAMIVVTPNWQ